ncbi:MAG: hypothetical protein ACP5XB_07655 [Isosphaeraceae bacterium]
MVQQGQFEWIPLLSASEQGTATATITEGGPIASIQLTGSHQHIDTVTVDQGGPFQFRGVPYNNNGLQVYEQTNLGSTTPYQWNLQDSNGNFNPNWTVTVNFTVDLQWPNPNQFSVSANINIASNYANITLQTGQYTIGGQPGLTIRAPGGAILYQDINFTQGSDTFEETMPAQQTERIVYGSAMISGPDGTFTYGTTGETPGLSWSYGETVNI